MGTPATRTPVRIARGTYSNLNTNKADIQEGEICYAHDENKLYVKEGSNLEAHASADSTKLPLAGGTMTGAIALGTNKLTGVGDPTGAQDAATKTYVDTADALKLPLGGGTMTGTLNGTVGTFTGKVTGDSFEMETGVNSEGYYIKDGSGNTEAALYYSSGSSKSYCETDVVSFPSAQFWIKASGDETCIDIHKDGKVAISYDNAVKFETASSGVQVYGDVIFEGATDDAHETTLAVVDATADRTITLPNATGTVGLLQSDQTWTGAQRGSLTTITYGATVNVDLDATNNHKVTLTGNIRFNNPSTADADAVGQSGSIFIIQDGTGNRTGAWGTDGSTSSWHWKGGTAPTLSTAANAVDRIDYIVYDANKIHAVATIGISANT